MQTRSTRSRLSILLASLDPRPLDLATMKLFGFSVALFALSPLAAQTQVDTSGSGVLIDQAMNRSEVMQNLEHLSDVIGPRLSGSPAMRRANEWTAEQFRSYGPSAALEPFDFGVTWERGPLSLRIVEPF